MTVDASVVVFNHPEHRGKAFDMKGQNGEIVSVLDDWKGRPISPTLPVIVAFGDSLSAGFGLDEADAFPVRLETALRAEGIDATVVNSGVSGETSAGGRARLDWSLPEAVDLVIVELGANDGLRGIDPAETEANLDAILDLFGSRTD